MKDQAEHEAPAVLAIPQPAVRRVIAIAAIAFYLAAFAILPWKLGFDRFLHSLSYFSATWVVVFIVSLPIAFFARLAFPPKGSLPRLEVSRSCVRIVPGRIARMFAEEPVEIALFPQSREILLCHSVRRGFGDGLRLVVRAADGTEREIRASSTDYLSARDAQKLAEGISAATGLPALLATRIRQEGGTVREAVWNPPPRKMRVVSGVALASGAIPFVGGTVMGLLWPAPAVILAFGLGLWLSQMGLLFLLARRAGSRGNFATLYGLSTVFTFAATYGFVVVAVGFLFRGR